MLKKLAKYGNSNALILDRCILALLDITEGSVVKLRIEGDALIIKAEKNVKPTDVLMSEVESVHERINAVTASSNPLVEIANKNMRDFCEKAEQDPKFMAMLKEWAPGTANYQKLQDAYEKIMKKYPEEMKALGSQEFQTAVQKLNGKYKNDQNYSEFYQQLLALRLQCSPGLAEMDREMRDVTEALGYPPQFYDQNLIQ